MTSLVQISTVSSLYDQTSSYHGVCSLRLPSPSAHSSPEEPVPGLGIRDFLQSEFFICQDFHLSELFLLDFSPA